MTFQLRFVQNIINEVLSTGFPWSLCEHKRTSGWSDKRGWGRGVLWEPVHRYLEWALITFVEPCTILCRKDIHVQCVPTM
mgnify:CR=1 FL=1